MQEKDTFEKILNEKLKYEIADELGLLNKVSEAGWKNLTSSESGKIGGLLNKRRKDLNIR